MIDRRLVTPFFRLRRFDKNQSWFRIFDLSNLSMKAVSECIHDKDEKLATLNISAHTKARMKTFSFFFRDRFVHGSSCIISALSLWSKTSKLNTRKDPDSPLCKRKGKWEILSIHKDVVSLNLWRNYFAVSYCSNRQHKRYEREKTKNFVASIFFPEALRTIFIVSYKRAARLFYYYLIIFCLHSPFHWGDSSANSSAQIIIETNN